MAQTMRALVVARYGGRLELAERPVPRPDPGKVLVRVRAGGPRATDTHLLLVGCLSVSRPRSQA